MPPIVFSECDLYDHLDDYDERDQDCELDERFMDEFDHPSLSASERNNLSCR